MSKLSLHWPAQDKLGGANCFAVQVASGVEGGVTLAQAVYGTQEPVASVLREKFKWENPMRVRVPI